MSFSIYFYGDSLTDNGNLCRVLGRDLTYADFLPARLHITDTSNYARCGSTSNDLSLQVAQYKKLSLHKSEAAIHSIFIGGNDFLSFNPWDITSNIYDAIQGIKEASQSQHNYFFLYNLPHFSNVPVIQQFIEEKCDYHVIGGLCKLALSGAVNMVSEYHSLQMKNLVSKLQQEGDCAFMFDVKDFYAEMLSNRVALGFYEEISCQVLQGCPNGFFHDDRHPTSKAHQLIAEWLEMEITKIGVLGDRAVEECG